MRNHKIFAWTLEYDWPYPEVLTHEAVDERVDEAVGVGQPEAGEVGESVECPRSVSGGYGEIRIKVVNAVEGLKGQPAQREQDHDRHQHLDHLTKSVKTVRQWFTVMIKAVLVYRKTKKTYYKSVSPHMAEWLFLVSPWTPSWTTHLWQSGINLNWNLHKLIKLTS